MPEARAETFLGAREFVIQVLSYQIQMLNHSLFSPEHNHLIHCIWFDKTLDQCY